MAPGFIPSAGTGLLKSFSMDGYFPQSRYNREGRGPSSKQCVNVEWIGFVVGREGGGNGRRVESGNWD